MDIHCNFGSEDKDNASQTNVLTVTIDSRKKLRDVLKRIGQIRGEILREQLYIFYEHNPFRPRPTVIFDLKHRKEGNALEYQSMNDTRTIDMNTPLKNIATTELDVLYS